MVGTRNTNVIVYWVWLVGLKLLPIPNHINHQHTKAMKKVWRSITDLATLLSKWDFNWLFFSWFWLRLLASLVNTPSLVMTLMSLFQRSGYSSYFNDGKISTARLTSIQKRQKGGSGILRIIWSMLLKRKIILVGMLLGWTSLLIWAMRSFEKFIWKRFKSLLAKRLVMQRVTCTRRYNHAKHHRAWIGGKGESLLLLRTKEAVVRLVLLFWPDH